LHEASPTELENALDLVTTWRSSAEAARLGITFHVVEVQLLVDATEPRRGAFGRAGIFEREQMCEASVGEALDLAFAADEEPVRKGIHGVQHGEAASWMPFAQVRLPTKPRRAYCKKCNASKKFFTCSSGAEIDPPEAAHDTERPEVERRVSHCEIAAVFES
jgi:hypothetical protein